MMSIDVHLLMQKLAAERPIFHSEADFQFALSTRIYAEYPECEVRLEKPFRSEDKTIYADIWMPEEGIALELKYFTRGLSTCRGGELFALRDHAARDFGRHHFLADVQRLEDLRWGDGHPVRSGFAVMLTNDPGLWRPSPRKTNDINFHLYDGRSLGPCKKLPWLKKGKPVEADEKRLRDGYTEISLRDSYTMDWRPYSDLRIAAGEFRYLVLAVGGIA